MKLYTYWRSSSAYRVRIALNLKGIACEHVAVHLMRDGGEQHRPEFVAMNPLAQVPVLELDGGERLTQSLPIIELLEERFPEPPLLPEEAVARARVRAFAEIVNSGIQPLQNSMVFIELEKRGIERGPWARFVIERGLVALERALEQESGPFTFGAAPTLADIFLIPQLYNARRFGLELAPFPRLLRAERACQALPAFRDAAPERQPDAETP